MKKITPVFGPQELFDKAHDNHSFAIQTKVGINFFISVSTAIEVAINMNKDEFIQFAQRRIEETPEPKRWTVADQKAGRLPDIGYKFEFTREQEKAFAYLNGKEGWENGDILEVIHTCVDQDGDLWAIVINTDPEVLSTARLRINFFTPEETPDEKAARLEDEYLNMIAKYYPEFDIPTARFIYKAQLSGEFPPVQAKDGE